MKEYEESEYVTTKKVRCEGNAAGTGHPLIYLEMGKEKSITCPYCSKHFIYQG